VLGVDQHNPGRAEDVAREVYAQILDHDTPFIVTDLATAELVKVSANAFLATKISFINAIAEVCEATGADVLQLADAIGHDERIGRKFLGAGLGFGGGCLPKDIRAFMARAGELGVDQALTFLREVDAVNLRRREHVVSRAADLLGGSVKGARIAVLGAAFKPNSDDVRDSPALDVAGRLHLAGADVWVYDPEGMANAAAVSPTLGYGESIEDVCAGADLVIVATEWSQFRSADPAALAAIVANARVIDARNCLPAEDWIGAGWTYIGMGRFAT
jgi:UDPglucose 6-dehydrogenase